ncbi:hypothetical protein [Methylopila sp. M107]|uniref:hypothetical protein n=1 Tax=Methylopila sp. M107 TaxID=1101190 RepID=UPI0012DDBD9A|nr:hypothetical protein [Methylopila sp. M107]
MRLLISAALAAGVAASGSTAALADSCWSHNGSLMRLVAQGPSRKLVYETPRPGIEAAGGRRGVVLFEGTRTGDQYEGTAHIFNETSCPGAPPLAYRVSGFAGDQQIVLSGTRNVFENCEPTGATKLDRLVFTYSHQC